jgi:hypothetical protein
MTVIMFIVLAAFICAVVSAIGRCPLWVSVILLCIAEMIRVIPLR